jgi:predicted enzyme related to lactoylglutathione lyase
VDPGGRVIRARVVEAQVFVTDLKRAEAFYGGALGFALTSRGDTWLIYDAGLELVVMAGARSAKDSVDYGSRADTVLCLEVKGIEGAVRQLRAAGVRFLTEIEAVPQGKFAAFADPDGNLFELIER